MKKCIASIIFLMMTCLSIMAQNNYNAKQEKLRNDIKKYLLNEGYNVENQSDGLKFRFEDVNYYIEIDPECTDLMYVRLCRYIKYDSWLTQEKARENLNDYNDRYVIKVACQDNSIVCSAEQFVNNADDFTYSFYDLFFLMRQTCDKITE